jgi:4,5-dihydroxyphthalate decarboxylase
VNHVTSAQTSNALTVAVGDPGRFAEIVSASGVAVDPQPQVDYVENLLRMSQDARFDLCEMPLAALLQGLEAGLPVRVLPVIMLRRTPHLYWLGDSEAAADGLGGVVTGVRSWAQTTGVWLRAALADQFGLTPRKWITSDEERYEQFPLPAGVRHLPNADGVAGLLRDGVVRAIVAPTAPAASGALGALIENPLERAHEWLAASEITPINHVLICSETAFRERGDELRAVVEALRAHALAPGAPRWGDGDEGMAHRPIAECFDPEAMHSSVRYLAPFAIQQGVLTSIPDLRDRFATV